MRTSTSVASGASSTMRSIETGALVSRKRAASDSKRHDASAGPDRASIMRGGEPKRRGSVDDPAAGAILAATGAQTEDGMAQCDVLITGAGPTGLVLALWLTKLGARVRIVDKTAGPGTTSRALAVQARTLELYRQLDLTEAVVANGHHVPAINLWVRGERATRFAFENVGSDLTPYPFLHIFPQDQHERLLIERLQALGVAVERRTELLGFDDAGDRVIARLRGPEGHEETCEAA